MPYAIPFLIQIWLFLLGGHLRVNALPEKWQWVLSLNPMTAVITGFRWARRSGRRARARARSASASPSAVIFFVVGLSVLPPLRAAFADTI